MTPGEFQAWFDGNFWRVIDREIITSGELIQDADVRQLVDHVRVLAESGKRVRPYFCWLSYVSHGGTGVDEIVDYLVVLELVHLFALIHDDVMDDAKERRGVPTIQALYRDAHESGLSSQTPENLAILVGDLVYTWCFDVLRNVTPRKTEAENLLFEMLRQVIVGQMIDVRLSGRLSVSRDELGERNHLKTASYTFIQPLRIGRALAAVPIDHEHEQLLAQFGGCLGEAFQTQDDYLDVFSGDPRKDVGADISAGEPTELTRLLGEQGSETDQAFLASVFGKPLTASEMERLRIIMRDAGVEGASRTYFETKYDEAESYLPELSFDPEYESRWRRVIELLRLRSS